MATPIGISDVQMYCIAFLKLCRPENKKGKPPACPNPYKQKPMERWLPAAKMSQQNLPLQHAQCRYSYKNKTLYCTENRNISGDDQGLHFQS